MFDIKDSVNFYRLMIENYDDFVENSGSSRHAINCAISAFHIADWIWGDWLCMDFATWKKLDGVRDFDSFKAWIDCQTSFFQVVQGVANGSKHFAQALRRTRATGTYVEEGHVEPGYQQQYLEIQVDGRWIEAIDHHRGTELESRLTKSLGSRFGSVVVARPPGT